MVLCLTKENIPDFSSDSSEVSVSSDLNSSSTIVSGLKILFHPLLWILQPLNDLGFPRKNPMIPDFLVTASSSVLDSVWLSSTGFSIVRSDFTSAVS